MENYLKPYKWTYLNEVVHTSNNLQQQTGHYRITTAFQNHAMYLFGLSTQQELTHKQPIHLYMILLVIYQPMLTYHDVISRLEMVMNTLIFIINHLQIEQEFLEDYWSMFTQTTIFKVEQFLIWTPSKKFIQVFTLI